MDIVNALAVITGGASGLGLATAEAIVAAGGKVVLVDVQDEAGAAAVCDGQVRDGTRHAYMI